MKVVVLSGKYAETKRFVAAMNLPPTTPHIVNADRLNGLRGDVEVHVLPSYHDRRDQGSIERKLRHAQRRGTVVRRFWDCVGGEWRASGGDLQGFENGELYAAAPLTVEEVRARHEDPTDDQLAQLAAAPQIENDDFLSWLDEDEEAR